MWLSEQTARPAVREADGDVAVVTIGGSRSAVQSGGERRDLACAGPGGILWAPEEGREVVTLTCAGGETVILGTVGGTGPALAPGELCLTAGDSQILLRRDGTITLRGSVNIDGGLTVNGLPVMGL